MTDSPRGRIRGPRMPSLRNAAGDLAAVPTLPTRGRGTSPAASTKPNKKAEKELEAG